MDNKTRYRIHHTCRKLIAELSSEKVDLLVLAIYTEDLCDLSTKADIKDLMTYNIMRSHLFSVHPLLTLYQLLPILYKKYGTARLLTAYKLVHGILEARVSKIDYNKQKRQRGKYYD